MTNIETRLAQLERRTAIWQVVAVGSMLMSGAMILNACRKTAPQPNHFDLLGKNGSKLSIDGDGLTFTHGDVRLSLTPDAIKMVEGGRTMTAAAGTLGIESTCAPKAKDCSPSTITLDASKQATIDVEQLGSATKLTPGAMSVGNAKGATIAVTAGDTDAKVTLRSPEIVVPEPNVPNQKITRHNQVELNAADDYALVRANTFQPFPDREISSTLWANLHGASVDLRGERDAKQLAVGDKK